MATFVLVHGGWDGGWGWRKVARKLQVSGHEVFTPTLTGSGERVHLATPEVGLDTHILDVANLLRYEDLYDVILVGTSYGGMVITGVAEIAPERIGQMIYLDAFVPQDGESVNDMAGPELSAGLAQAAQAFGDGWRVPHNPPDADRRTDFLLKAATQPLQLKNPAAANLPHAYVLFTAKPPSDPLAIIFGGIAARVREERWKYQELATDHWPMLDKPNEVAQLLLGLI